MNFSLEMACFGELWTHFLNITGQFALASPLQNFWGLVSPSYMRNLLDYLRQGGCNRRCLSVCLLATLRKNVRTDLHEIGREVVDGSMNK